MHILAKDSVVGYTYLSKTKLRVTVYSIQSDGVRTQSMETDNFFTLPLNYPLEIIEEMHRTPKWLDEVVREPKF